MSALLLCSTACPNDAVFVCNTPDQCGPEGRCEDNGGCSFPDPGCGSGRRFGELSNPGPVCVPPEPVAGTQTVGTTAVTTTTLPGSGPDATTTTTAPLTASDASTTSSPSDSSTSTTGDTGDSSSTGGLSEADFYDDFERPDADDVGNGWVEKTPDAFVLRDGGLVRVVTNTSYPDNLVYRPDREWLDAELTVEFVIDTPGENAGTAQCVVRTQLADIDEPGSVTGYLLYLTSSNRLEITRQIAGEFTQQFSTPFDEPLVVGTPYRMRLRALGTDPVDIDGYLEWFDGDAWQVYTEVHGTDDTPERIATPGTVVLGANTALERWTYQAATVISYD